VKVQVFNGQKGWTDQEPISEDSANKEMGTAVTPNWSAVGSPRGIAGKALSLLEAVSRALELDEGALGGICAVVNGVGWNASKFWQFLRAEIRCNRGSAQAP
jgi:hypothetical protein